MPGELSTIFGAALAAYTVFSVSYFAIQWHRLHGALFASSLDGLVIHQSPTFKAYVGELWSALNMMHSASWSSLASLLNLLVNVLALSTVAVKQIFLGELSLLETHKLLEFVVGYSSFKFMLLLALVDVLPAKPLWFVWFLAVSCVKILGVLAKERYHRLSTSPTASLNSHLRTLTLFVLILVANTLLAGSLLLSTSWGEIPVSLLLLYEPLVIGCDCSQALFQYALHVAESHPELLQQRKAEKADKSCDWVSSAESPEWQELRSWLLYNASFLGEGCVTLLTILHCCLVWLVRGFTFSVVDVVLFLNIRAHALSLLRRIWAFTRWHSVLSSLRAAFPDATQQQLIDFADDCAICRDTLSAAKRLPCGHIFHLSCLRSWFEQSAHTPCSCPTCRRPLEGLSLSSIAPAAASMGPPREPGAPTSLLSLFARILGARNDSRQQQHRPVLPQAVQAPEDVHPGPAGAELVPQPSGTGAAAAPARQTDGATGSGSPAFTSSEQPGEAAGLQSRAPFSMSLRGLRFRGSRGAGDAAVQAAASSSLGGEGGNGSATGSSRGLQGPDTGSSRMVRQLPTSGSSGQDRLAQMTERVAEVLPHVPLAVIQEDLSRTNSVLLTVDRLMETW